MKVEMFKNFIRLNPPLFDAISKNKFGWQEAFIAYDVYGEKAEIFQNILKIEKEKTVSMDSSNTSANTSSKLDSQLNQSNVQPTQATNSTGSIIDFVNNLDVDKVNHLVDQLSKGIGILKGFLPDHEVKTEKEKQVFQRFND